MLEVNTLNELINYFKVFIRIQMFYLNSKVYILMKDIYVICRLGGPYGEKL